jgi:hypothetical protein
MTGVFRTLSFIDSWKQQQPVSSNGRRKKVTHFFVRDEASALSENLLKVYPRRHTEDQKN